MITPGNHGSIPIKLKIGLVWSIIPTLHKQNQKLYTLMSALHHQYVRPWNTVLWSSSTDFHCRVAGQGGQNNAPPTPQTVNILTPRTCEGYTAWQRRID